jgi:hypothetical protein
MDQDNPDYLYEQALAFRAKDDSDHAAEKLRRALKHAVPDWPRRAEAEKALRAWTGGR